MNPFGERIDAATVRFERTLPGPIDRVWAYLTDGEKRAKWLAGGNTELAVGGIIELKFHNASLSPLSDDPRPEKYKDMPEKMYFSGQIIRYEPPNVLAHTWEDDGNVSEVEYVLKEQDEKVLLVITHRRLQPEDVLGVCGGWHVHLDILDDVLEGCTPRPFWKNHTAAETAYAARLESD